MSNSRLGFDCSQIGSIIPTISPPSNEESSKYQLPALPILLELVVHKTKDHGFSGTSACLAFKIRLVCLLEPPITRHHALHTAPLTKDATPALVFNIQRARKFLSGDLETHLNQGQT